MNLKDMTTEQENPRSKELDSMPIGEALKLINNEDKEAITAVRNVIPQIEKAVMSAVESFENGGRLLYIGAGTSGRLGILDAAECPPTFGTDPSQVQAVIAGGEHALIKAIEGAEDDASQGRQDLEKKNLGAKDTVVGLSASGRTPYVRGALEYANEIGAKTVGVSCNGESVIGKTANIPIELITGPEVLTGSTRLKAGTAQKMVLNMISTMAMVKIGKVYKNYMVDLQATNEKLKRRAVHIVSSVTNVSMEEAEAVLVKSDNEVKTAIIAILKHCDPETARTMLEKTNGIVSKTLTSKENEND
ncbi:MAG: N-acetylmuramic acid 6-phosphate etherase [Bacillota bacterium]